MFPRILRASSVAVLLFLFTLLTYAQPSKGQADLSQYNFENGPYILSGEWEFYWNQLLSPEDFKIPREAQWIYPGSWHRQGDYSTLGFATYRIKLKLPESQNRLSLYFPIINSSAKIWINGSLVAEAGTVSSDKQLYKPKLTGTIVTLPEKERDLEVIVQVVNYTYYSGGMAGTPEIDRSSSIFVRMNRTNGIENFFAGSLMAMFIYQLMLYFLYHQGKPNLWLALICLGVALRAMIVHGGSFLLPNLYPSVGWETWKKIEFGSVYAIVALFPLYVYHLFPAEAPRKPIIFFIVVSAALCLMVLVTPQYTYGQLLEVCHGALLIAFIYAVYSIGKAWRDGNKDARIILFGVIASFPFILAEILKNSSVYPLNIEFMYLVEMGVLLFLLFQVYLLANHYAKSYRNLETLNQSLEKIVAERTGQLSTANTVKDRLLSVMSHDIKSPLNSLRGVLQVYNQGSITREEFAQFTQHIESDLSKTSVLVEDILFWTSNQLKGVEVKMEKFDLSRLIDDNVNLFQTIAHNKRITISHQGPKNLTIRSDKNILNFVLRNLIGNAIKFSYEGGSVNILVRKENNFLTIQVQDRGVGMDEKTMTSLLSPVGTVSSSGTSNETGTGLGVGLCREYLQKIGGQLSVESSKGNGTTFSVLLMGEGQ